MNAIDFVLPWVDVGDQTWQMNMHDHTAETRLNTAEITKSRYRDMGTLKYVLRSIEKHCPWYHKIHIITAGHCPPWLNVTHEAIHLITHDELYHDKSHLPVFSSSSIEMNLSNINGLSDKFVYLNDDTVIMRPLGVTRFFVDGMPVDFFYHGWFPRNRLFGKIRGMDTWIQALNNSLNLLNNRHFPLNVDQKSLYHHSYDVKTKISNFLLDKLYKRLFWLKHWHHPQPYLKQTLQDVYSEFRDEMMICSSNRFRANNDLTHYLYRYWHLVNNEFSPYKHNDGLVSNIDSFGIVDWMIKEIDQNKSINFVCFNDSKYLSDEEYFKVKNKLISYLDEKFPLQASFED